MGGSKVSSAYISVDSAVLGFGQEGTQAGEHPGSSVKPYKIRLFPQPLSLQPPPEGQSMPLPLALSAPQTYQLDFTSGLAHLLLELKRCAGIFTWSAPSGHSVTASMGVSLRGPS